MVFDGFWEFLNSIEPIDILWLLLWFLAGICPPIFAAIKIKKRIKVGAVGFAEFTLAYIIILGLFYGLLWWTIGADSATRLFANLSGFIVALPIMVLIFNHISEGIRKTYIVEFELARKNINISSCYTYEHGGQIRVILLDEFGRESFWSLLKRIFGKHKYLLYEGANFDFTEHKVNIAYLCTDWTRRKEWIEVDGKECTCDIINVKPIPATEFSELQFLINYKKWMDLQTRYAQEYSKRMEIEKDILTIAIDLYRNWVRKTEEGRWSDQSLSTDAVLAKYLEERQKAVERAKKAMTSPEFQAETEELYEEAEEAD